MTLEERVKQQFGSLVWQLLTQEQQIEDLRAKLAKAEAEKPVPPKD